MCAYTLCNYVYVYIYAYIHTYIYTYIYIFMYVSTIYAWNCMESKIYYLYVHIYKFIQVYGVHLFVTNASLLLISSVWLHSSFISYSQHVSPTQSGANLEILDSTFEFGRPFQNHPSSPTISKSIQPSAGSTSSKPAIHGLRVSISQGLPAKLAFNLECSGL